MQLQRGVCNLTCSWRVKKENSAEIQITTFRKRTMKRKKRSLLTSTSSYVTAASHRKDGELTTHNGKERGKGRIKKRFRNKRKKGSKTAAKAEVSRSL